MANASASDPGYDQYAAARTEAYKQAVANIHNQRDNLLRQAGLSGVYDSSGNLTDYHVAAGPGSEFGAYQQTMAGLANRGEQLDAQKASLGFGGGLAQQMSDLGAKDDAATYNDFSQGVLSGMAGFGQQEADAGTSYWNDLFSQLHQNAAGKVANQDFTTADFSGLMDNIGPYGQPNQVDNGPYGNNNNLNPSGTHWHPPKPKPRRRRR